MTIRFAAPVYPGGRMYLLSGTVTVGAVFPPAGSGSWSWRIFVSNRALPEGYAKSELAAKNALRAAWLDFVHAAGLQVREGGE